MRRAVKAPLIRPCLLAYKVQNTSGTLTLETGGAYGSLTDNGTGDSTFTYGKYDGSNPGFASEPIVVAMSSNRPRIHTSSATSARVQTHIFSGGGTAQEATDHTHVFVLGSLLGGDSYAG